MKIHTRLAWLLLIAALSACGSDLGGSKGEPLSSTGAVITSNPVTSPLAANKATVGFRVIFPEAAGAKKAAINPTMTRVTIATSGVCGSFSLELTPSNNTGVMTLGPGACTFTASAFDSFNAKIDTATTQGSLLAGINDISLTFLGGPWLFVDPNTNDKASLTLVGGEILTGIRFARDFTANTVLTRWIGPDLNSDGPTGDDFMGGGLAATDIPTIGVTGSFTGGTGSGTNLVRLNDGFCNLTDWKRTFSSTALPQRFISILGANFRYPTTFNPSSYLDYHTTKVIDGTTIEGNIVEYTMDSTSNSTPYGTCSAMASKAAETDAFIAALSAARKAQTSIIGTVTASWTICDVNNMYQDVTRTYSNVTIHPFKARSVFADPISALQVMVNSAIANYKSALATEDLVKGMDLAQLRKAASQFVAAVELAGESDLSNTADTARFFGAISRLASLGIDTASDGVADGLNDLNDVLDALGVPTDSLSRSWSKTVTFPESCATLPPYDCRPNLPTNSPTSGQLLTLLDAKVNTQLDLAIADLSRISAGFSYNFIDAAGAMTNFDYGDVLALIAVAHGIKAELAIDMAYDLNLDIDATINGSGPASVQAFMDANPTLGSLDASRFAAELAQAKIALQTALNKMNEAIDVIEAEGTGVAQDLEFISFYKVDNQCIPNQTGIFPYCTWTTIDSTVQNIANTRDAISKALTGLNGPITVDDNRTPDNTADDTIIDPSKFFAGISFRALLPTFTGDVPNGFFPDPTMGGVLVQTPMNINADVDGNGKPDLLERPNFYAGLISGKTYSNEVWTPTLRLYQTVTFSTGATNGTFTSSWSYYQNIPLPPYSIYQEGTATGTWQIRPDGSLQIVFTTGAPLTITGMNSSLVYYPGAMDQSFDVKTTVTFADGSTMTTYSQWMIPQTSPL